MWWEGERAASPRGSSPGEKPKGAKSQGWGSKDLHDRGWGWGVFLQAPQFKALPRPPFRALREPRSQLWCARAAPGTRRGGGAERVSPAPRSSPPDYTATTTAL